MAYQFDWAPVWHAIPQLLSASLVSLQIAALAFFVGAVIAFFLALGKLSPHRLFSFPAKAWIELARNTPCLFQIYMIYFGLGALSINLSPYVSVLIAITFNNAGYSAEIIRGGLAAIPPAQHQSARGLGMSSASAYMWVVIPQLLPVIYLPSVSQFIWSLLNSSLGMIVGLNDLTGVAYQLQSVTFRTFEFFAVTAVIYYVMVKIITTLSWIAGLYLVPGWSGSGRR
jgi:polar amino acid transport system permease protein